MEQSYTPILTEEERAKRRALRAQARRKKQLARRRRFTPASFIRRWK